MLAADFEQNWTPTSADSLRQRAAEVPDLGPLLLRTLIIVDLRCRLKAGQMRTPEEHLADFPEYADDSELLVELIAVALRYSSDPPDHAALRRAAARDQSRQAAARLEATRAALLDQQLANAPLHSSLTALIEIADQFHQARTAWDDEPARLGERDARLELIDAALQTDDLALADAQVEALSATGEDVEEIRQRVSRAFTLRRRSRQTRLTVSAVVVAFVLLGSMAYFFARDKQRQRLIEETQQRHEETEKNLAVELRKRAEERADVAAKAVQRGRVWTDVLPLLERAGRAGREQFHQGEALYLAGALTHLGELDPDLQDPLRLRWQEALQAALAPVHVSARRLTLGSLAYSGDGQWLAAYDVAAGAIRVWRMSNHSHHVALVQQVRDLAFLPDQPRHLVARSPDGTARLWDVETGREKPLDAATLGQLFDAPRAPLPDVGQPATAIRSAAVRPDGKEAATAGVDGTLRIWSLPDHRLLRQTEGRLYSAGAESPPISAFAHLRDAELVVTAGPDPNGVLFVHDARSLRPRAAFGTRPVSALALAPDGQRVVCADHEGSLEVWNLETRAKVATMPPQGKAHTGVTALTWTPKGDRLASIGSDGKIRLWDGVQPKPLVEWDGAGSVLLFDAQGELLISGGSDGTLRLWDVKSGKAADQLRLHVEPVTAAALSLDGRVLASGSADGLIVLWDLPRRRALARYRQLAHTVQSLAFSSDGTRLAAAQGDGSLALLDLTSGHIRARAVGHELAPAQSARLWVSFTSDDRLLTAGNDGTLRHWDFRSAAGRVLDSRRRAADRLAVAADSSEWAGLTVPDGALVRWDRRTTEELPGWSSPDDAATSLAYGRDKKLVFGTRRGRLFVMDLERNAIATEYRGPDGQRQPGAPNSPIAAVAVSPDGKLAATPWQGGVIDLWQLADGKHVRTLPGSGKQVHSLEFRPNGKQFASADVEGGLSLWDVATGTLQGTKLGGPGQIPWLCFHKSGKWLAQSGQGASVAVWDVDQRQRVQELVGHRAVPLAPDVEALQTHVAAYSPNGRLLATGGGDDTVRLWESTSGARLAVIRVGFLRQLGRSTDPTRDARPGVQALAWGPDSQTLLVGGQRFPVQVLNVEPYLAQVSPGLPVEEGTVRRVGLRRHGERLTPLEFFPLVSP